MKRIILTCVGSIDLNGGCHYVNLHNGLNVITGDRETGKSTILEIIDYCFGKSENDSIPKTINSITKWHFVVCQMGQSYFLLGRNVVAIKKFVLTNIAKERKDYYNIIMESKTIDWKEINRLLFFKHGIEIETLKDYATEKERIITYRNCLSFCFQKGDDITSKKNLFYRMDNSNKKRSLILELPLLIGFINFAFYKRLDEINSCKKEVSRITDRIKSYDEDTELKKINEMVKTLFIETNNEEFLEKVKSKETFLEYRKNLDDFDPYDSNGIDFIKQIKVDINDYEKDLNRLNYKLFQIEQQFSSFNDISKKFDIVQQKSMIIEDLFENLEISEELKVLFNDMRGVMNEELSKININKNMNLEYERTKLKKQLSNLKSKRNDAIELYRSLEKQYKINTSFKEKIKEMYKLEAQIEDGFENYNNLLLNMRKILNQYEDDLAILEAKHDEEKKIKDKNMKEFENNVSMYMNEDIKELYPSFEHKSKKIQFDLNELDCYYELSSENVYLSSWGSDNNVMFPHVASMLAIQRTLSNTNSCIPAFIVFDQLSRPYFPDNLNMRKSKDFISLNRIFDVIVKVINETKSNTGDELQVIVLEHANEGMSKTYNKSKIKDSAGNLITFANGIKYINESIYETNVFNVERKEKEKNQNLKRN